jgi:hypothetical protein
VPPSAAPAQVDGTDLARSAGRGGGLPVRVHRARTFRQSGTEGTRAPHVAQGARSMPGAQPATQPAGRGHAPACRTRRVPPAHKQYGRRLHRGLAGVADERCRLPRQRISPTRQSIRGMVAGDRT